MDPAQTAQIRALNDLFRSTFEGGDVMLTQGVVELDGKTGELLEHDKRFDAFEEGDDPYRQHDFGAIDFAGAKFFWKIDYYDKAKQYGSEHPEDPAQTCRVLTIMRADEY